MSRFYSCDLEKLPTVDVKTRNYLAISSRYLSTVISEKYSIFWGDTYVYSYGLSLSITLNNRISLHHVTQKVCFNIRIR